METRELLSDWRKIVSQLRETSNGAKLNPGLDANYLVMRHIVILAKLTETSDEEKSLSRALDYFLKIREI